MARNFNGSSDYIQGAAVATAVPLTMAAWFYKDDNTTNRMILSLSETTGSSRFCIEAAGLTSGDPIRADAKQGANSGVAVTTSGFSASTWTHACGVFRATNNRSAYINGGSRGNNTSQTRTPFGINGTVLGASYVAGSLGEYFNGLIAEVGIWNIDLNDDEVLSLAKGFSPRLVRPQSLVFYAPLVRNVQDLRGGITLTTSGTTVADHPRIYA
jgi:hypothetical protein